MKYYQYRNTVIECHDDIKWQEIVLKMRSVVNKDTFHPINIMIEDIEEVDYDDYIESL